MTKYITVIVAVALLFCFSGKAYCLSLGNLQQVVQQAASAAGNRASIGTSNKSANNSSPLAVANVQDDGVFYTAEAASPTEKRSEPFTVFDIPLNASPQEVFNVIEKKGMDFREGCFNDKREMEKFSENGLRDLVSRYYEAQGISGASKRSFSASLTSSRLHNYF